MEWAANVEKRSRYSPSQVGQFGRFFHGSAIAGNNDLVRAVEVGTFNQPQMACLRDDLLDGGPVQTAYPAHLAKALGHRVLHEQTTPLHQLDTLFEPQDPGINQGRILTQTEPGRHVGDKAIT